MFKICSMCAQSKPITAFARRRESNDGYRSSCRDCRAVRSATKKRADQFQGKYNLTLLEYQKMILDQKGLCKICGLSNALHVDHCHDSGEVRGLLCINCNTALGSFKNDVKILESAIEYLKRTPDVPEV